MVRTPFFHCRGHEFDVKHVVLQKIIIIITLDFIDNVIKYGSRLQNKGKKRRLWDHLLF